MPRPHRVDVLIAVSGLLGGFGLWGLGIGLRTPPFPALPDAWLLLPLVLMSALELLRRTLPQTALALGTLLLVADQLTPGSLVTIILFADLAYAAVLYGSPAAARRIPWTTGLVTVGSTIGFLAWFQEPEAVLLGVMIGLVGFAPATTGAIVRNHRDAAETARLRAEQTALLAEMDRTQAVTAERARMARELHDMVANHLSAIAIHSTAALSLDDPGTTRDALGVIRENSVEGLAEMRRLIGLLRDGSDDHEPAAAPTLDGLAALAEQARANGLDVTLDGPSLDGRTLADHRRTRSPRLPAPVELAAYRIVQESLTNALKHAAPGPVHVALSLPGETLTVTVTSPFGDPSGPRAPGSGAGLVGMRERASLLGGEFEAGPREDADGTIWYVRAALPVEGGSE
ncbi:sensor histidine kinase [Streptomyces cavernicola]|uniref:histidine kinase n=1 Tax=Streptomyces cavernicola TaxID=3043613 RepID=A0ABT6S8T6_9ACTN|nr:histidine kinase [Streptomyces sp. B-S-A6]MDI3404507.1 histidine kinase [Streptomyces sp. B-S-A6]